MQRASKCTGRVVRYGPSCPLCTGRVVRYGQSCPRAELSTGRVVRESLQGFALFHISLTRITPGLKQRFDIGKKKKKKKKRRSDWSWIQPMAICLVNSWSYLPCQNYTALWVMTHFWRKKMAPLRKSKWGTPPKIHVSPWRNVLNPVWIVSRKNKEIM